MEIKKGNANSGNRGHAGRPGQQGGSGRGPMRNGHLMLAGKTARELADQQQLLSDGMAQQVMSAFEKSGTPTEMTTADLNTYLDRLGEHRALMLDETLAVAERHKLSQAEQDDLAARLMRHDADKYNFDIAEAYAGSFKLDRKTYEGAFTAAMTGHHLRSPHHWEYHVTTETVGGQERKTAQAMPTLDYVEMMGDWLGTARERGSPPAAYYRKFGKQMILNPATRRAAEQDLKAAEAENP